MRALLSPYISMLCLIASCGGRSGLDHSGSITTLITGGTGAAIGGSGNPDTKAWPVSTGGQSTITTSNGGSSAGVMAGSGGQSMRARPLAVSAGSFHTCARLDNGTIHCWGSNERGRLGDGTYVNATTPTQVRGVTSAVAVDCGGQHVCAVLDDGSARCWGSNDFGQLGNATTIESPEPVRVSNLDQVVSISAGYQHTCAVRADSTVWCWGANDSAQLGAERAASIPQPVRVDGIGPASVIAAGRAHTCAIIAGDVGFVVCWGSNSEAQLGVTTAALWSRTAMIPDLAGVFAIAAGSQHNCAITRDQVGANAVQCWGWNFYGQLGNSLPSAIIGTPSGLTTAISLSAADHSCALLRDGHVSCWGFNRSGELGNGSKVDTSVPQFTSGITDAISVSAGSVHSCALLASGDVKCWGDNSSGQLGDGSTRDSAVPVTVIGL